VGVSTSIGPTAFERKLTANESGSFISVAKMVHQSQRESEEIEFSITS